MRRKGDPAGQKRGGPAPFRRYRSGGPIGDDGRCGRADESVDCIPDGVKVGNLVSKKFDEIEAEGDAYDHRMSNDRERARKVNDAKTLKQAQRGDGGVEVEAGGEAGAEGESERF